jgi:hypothetical protein
MTIENEIKTRRIEFTRIESVKEHFPSHRIKINIETENIKADFNNYIWLSDSDIEKFLHELEILDKTRKGQATLQSMSPAEMTLTFEPIDVLGHLSASFRFLKDDRINKDYSFDIMVEFQIDPTSLPKARIESLKLME